MTTFQFEVRVKPRRGLLDPQGKAVHHSLNSLGWQGVADVRIGKAIYIDMEADSEADGREAVEAMCRRLLANPVTEDFDVTLVNGTETSA